MSPTLPATFPKFSSLAAELRIQIWQQALFDFEDGPALFDYHHIWLRMYFLQPSDTDWDPEGGYANESLAITTSPRALTRVPIPIAYVNREARSIAQKWWVVHRRRPGDVPSCTGRYDGENGPLPPPPLFARTFDRTRDTIFVNEGHWRSFYRAPADVYMQGMPDRMPVGRCFPRVAVPRALFKTKDNPGEDNLGVQGFLRYHCDLQEFMIVVGEPPKFDNEEPDAAQNKDGAFVQHVPRSYVLIDSGHAKFVWDAERRAFNVERFQRVDKELRPILLQLKKGFTEEMKLTQAGDWDRHPRQRFKIRTVFAVKR